MVRDSDPKSRPPLTFGNRECQNGGQLWGQSEEAGYDNAAGFPDAVCGAGFHSLLTAFIICLLVDLGFQVSC